jgi:hypothetical protein
MVAGDELVACSGGRSLWKGMVMAPSVKTELLYLAEVLMPVCPRPHLERSREAFVRHQLGCQVDPPTFLIGNRSVSRKCLSHVQLVRRLDQLTVQQRLNQVGVPS